MAAIEACVTSALFEKITAAQLQLPREQRQNIDAVLDVIATIAKAKDNVWVYRKAFDAYKQQTDQTFKQFYAKIVKLASMCEFGKDFCEDDKIRVVDQCLLMKLVLHTSDSIAQRKLMEMPDLDLATALQPLRPLLQKNAQPFRMNDEQTLAFKNAKAILTSNNVIAYYRPGAPLRLFTDASLKHGLGFYLKQQQTDNNWKTIQTGSRTLTPAETIYAPIELELQAIVYATKKCHNFFAGTKFNLFTDHRPLVSICNKQRLDNINNSRLLRSLLKSMDYNFTVNYISGSQNKVADSFSRNPVDNPDETDQQHADSQEFFLRLCRLSQAEMADCSFRLEKA